MIACDEGESIFRARVAWGGGRWFASLRPFKKGNGFINCTRGDYIYNISRIVLPFPPCFSRQFEVIILEVKFDEIPTERKRESGLEAEAEEAPFFASHPSQKINPESSSVHGAPDTEQRNGARRQRRRRNTQKKEKSPESDDDGLGPTFPHSEDRSKTWQMLLLT